MEVSKELILNALWETLYMVSISLFFGSIIGIFLGILLVVTRKGHIYENRFIFSIVNPIVNIFRSIPFIILLVAIIPFTRLMVGTSIGTTAAIVPLVLHIGPYISRLVENSLLEVDEGIIEAAKAMGATPIQIIFRFLMPEAFASLILSITTATIGLVGATAMAGAIGGGGLGDVAITYGYQRFSTITIFVTVVILVIVVQGVQSLGNIFERKIRRV
ncbi:methionine ABC transporter permease [Peribacillus frigoritolerans]|jgi:D-methionine transport system permease protein|uniref:methionine ABC transporter permease n=1 Tax=Peribacillus TaxID=2675229 RepID=UPI00070D87E0|nr:MULTISPECIES: methionine ABC transporter permease [Peribacillus]KRF50096.1 methionine ABC transporter permease [Bacillus sp. Soil745]MBD8136652.1 ABC transporter permease [Bacillus sp. CFBP 13597]MDP9742983.1 D-methionine transport system permease protein [Bacillus sp. B2I3]PAW29784.1 methionine ABC transporter permease [Peribacillus simplex]PEF40496.1 ABC transporter permease [Bacillus sp. AFS094228]PEO43768.1 ABC transporter permease [Bacillus sp. AFS026049]PHD76873.1 ABC transporter pe